MRKYKRNVTLINEYAAMNVIVLWGLPYLVASVEEMLVIDGFEMKSTNILD